MRIMAYGTAANAVGEKLGLSESSAFQCLVRFGDIVIDTCAGEELPSPTEAVVAGLLLRRRSTAFRA